MSGPDERGRWTAFRDVRYFGSLDGLRCLSILAVLWHHAAGGNRSGLAGSGYLGVPLFFAISGFLITTLLLRERERNGRIALGKFYLRRALRIFPLYYTVLAVYVVLMGWRMPGTPDSREFFGNLPYFVTYTSNWFVGATGVIFGFAWSLAAEEQFYCGWPWVEQWLGPRRAAAAMAGLVAVALAWQQWGPEGWLRGPLWWRILANIPAAICLGVLLAHLLHSRRGFAAAWSVLGARCVSPVALLILLAAIALGAPHPLVALLMAALVGACVIREDHWLAPVLRWRPVAYLGVISYGMYLLHVLAHRVELQAARAWYPGWDGHGPAAFLLVTFGTVAAAAASYHFYEARFQRLRARLRP